MSTAETSSHRGMTGSDYSWGDAVRDLSLSSQLTLKQSTDLTRALQRHNLIDPSHAMRLLAALLNAIRQNSFEEAGEVISRLIKSSPEVGRSNQLKQS